MKDKKLQVFVSSTYSDLREERQAAVEAILSSGHIPAGMELFAAGDETQLAVKARRSGLVGWIRGDNSIDGGSLAEEIVRLTSENATLRDKLVETKSGDEQLYSGLTYEQMEKLLKRR